MTVLDLSKREHRPLARRRAIFFLVTCLPKVFVDPKGCGVLSLQEAKIERGPTDGD